MMSDSAGEAIVAQTVAGTTGIAHQVGTGVDVVDFLLAMISVMSFVLGLVMWFDTMAFRRKIWWYSPKDDEPPPDAD